MPEGPSLVILRELVSELEGQKIMAVSGNSKIEQSRLIGQPIIAVKTWGKHFLLCFPTFTLKVHFLLFGSYRFNEQREDMVPRLSLVCDRDTVHFYACSVKYIEENLDILYDWTADIMSESWDPKAAKVKLLACPNTLVCDALLDQNIFAGVGNIIKNEVLFRTYLHPLSLIGAIPMEKLDELILEARNYSFDFLIWKKAYVLRKHYLVHTKVLCPRCEIRLSKGHLGKTNRRSFYCEKCQILYQKLI